MSHHDRDEKITAFVRNVLGCGCPDDVFSKIEVSNIDLGPDIKSVTRIVIGDTLLIYILPSIPIKDVAGSIGKFVTAGKADRDSHGYNRFRLVAHSGESREVEDDTGLMFSEAAAGDEKVHIHFIKSIVLNEAF